MKVLLLVLSWLYYKHASQLFFFTAGQALKDSSRFFIRSFCFSKTLQEGKRNLIYVEKLLDES